MEDKKLLNSISESIEIKGAKQNNLKNISLKIPLNKLTVVTGLSGSGKSTLAFSTLYAEGQRRYVETFSPYIRQFFDRMGKPDVDQINGIPPAIAIQQQGTISTMRSTVGSISEINDYLKLIFPLLCKAYDPINGKEICPDTPKSVLKEINSIFKENTKILILFEIKVPELNSTNNLFNFLNKNGYTKVLIDNEIYKISFLQSLKDKEINLLLKKISSIIKVVQDLVSIEKKSRILESLELSFKLGKGAIIVKKLDDNNSYHFSSSWSSMETGTVLEKPSSSLFNFNSPIGACDKCKGFGRIIEFDLEKIIPDKSLSIQDGVIRPFQGDVYSECQKDLKKYALNKGIDLNQSFNKLSKNDQNWIVNGDSLYSSNNNLNYFWYGVNGFFESLESKSYKHHVRIFLNRFRKYVKCSQCNGSRLKKASLNYKIKDKSIDDIWNLSIDDSYLFFKSLMVSDKNRTLSMLYFEIVSRLKYLIQVGLGYLTLARSSRTLSGGEIQRINLTTCLSSSITSTLFVFDEPSIGLHAKDINSLIEVIKKVRNLGNTIVIVEHEEAIIKIADYLVEIGPGKGESGGNVVYSGYLKDFSRNNHKSLTLDYLHQIKKIHTPKVRKTAKRFLSIEGINKNNLINLSLKIPLDVICCITGVSGSGKSTLVNSILHKNLSKNIDNNSSDWINCKKIEGHNDIANIIMVDQTSISKTPRSAPALYVGIFDSIRKLFSRTQEAINNNFTISYFSFNTGFGRCQRCMGNGYEKVEMQFLSDVYIKCEECKGERYSLESLNIKLNGKNISEVLQLTINQAIEFFNQIKSKDSILIIDKLKLLSEVGLDYLRLGQPLNTLSGGESQRIKLVKYISYDIQKSIKQSNNNKSIFILDEPTTGLHVDDINNLLKVFKKLVNLGHSLIIVEHNLELIKCSDYIIDIGPESGENGGKVVVQGTPESICKSDKSHTAKYLRSYLIKEKKPKEQSPLIPSPSYESTSDFINIIGAKQNNLKNIDISIPKNKFVVFTGLSGSGKSTIAFDIIFSEGQRIFFNTISPYTRQFVEQLERPEIDSISGLQPTVAIEQRVSRGVGKSTVATTTEIWNFLRLLFSKIGIQYSLTSGKKITNQTLSNIVNKISNISKDIEDFIFITSPLVKSKKGHHTPIVNWAKKKNFSTLFINGDFVEINSFKKLERFKSHTIDVLIDKINKHTSETRIFEIAQKALSIGNNLLHIIDSKKNIKVESINRYDVDTDESFEDPDPAMFSYNSSRGWCNYCKGYGKKIVINVKNNKVFNSVLESEILESNNNLSSKDEEENCPKCKGSRLNEIAMSIKINGYTINDIATSSITDAKKIINNFNLSKEQNSISKYIIPEIIQRLEFLEKVGLGYLELNRSTNTLSGGESQRTRLASQLGTNLKGVLYILDEPTIGLHPSDNDRLIKTLNYIKNKGNSLIVVEHDEQTINQSDYIIDVGPKSGKFGGEISWEGNLNEYNNLTDGVDSYTLNYFRSPIKHPINNKRRKLYSKNNLNKWIWIKEANSNNIKDLNVFIPINRLVVVVGVSGSGKSTLVKNIIKSSVKYRISNSNKKLKFCKSISKINDINDVYEIDQNPIGKSSKSNLATYTKLFDKIRILFSLLPESKVRGYSASRFSFNLKGGRCENCKGTGKDKIIMSFLPTSYVVCESCKGKRFNEETLSIKYNNKSISDIMDMSVEEAYKFFSNDPQIEKILFILKKVGIEYLTLGQSSTTLSGGESQRLKLASELSKTHSKTNGYNLKKNIYIIEEPSIGLHTHDVTYLLKIFHELVDAGHSVIIIEHNMSIISEADYIIEMGPEPGKNGGKIVFEGPPESLITNKNSKTSKYLEKSLNY